MDEGTAAERARVLNQKLGEETWRRGGTGGAYWLEQEVRPGDWEPVLHSEDKSLRKRLGDLGEEFGSMFIGGT